MASRHALSGLHHLQFGREGNADDHIYRKVNYLAYQSILKKFVVVVSDDLGTHYLGLGGDGTNPNRCIGVSICYYLPIRDILVL